MSIFDAGFIMWGYFLVYTLLTVAYLVWMVLENKAERHRGERDPMVRGDRS